MSGGETNRARVPDGEGGRDRRPATSRPERPGLRAGGSASAADRTPVGSGLGRRRAGEAFRSLEGVDPRPPAGGIAPCGIGIPRDAIAAFCTRWGVAELSLFGSALREDFRPESDVDLLVRFLPGRPYGLLALARMRGELESILGRPVDLVEEKAVERSENRIKRRHILETKVLIHAAG